MKNYKFVSAALLMVGLIVVGVCIKSGLNSMADNSRVVNVKGLAEMEVKANKVTWPVSFKIVGNDLSSIYQDVNRNNRIVKNFLISKGISDKEISVNAPQIVDKAADVYGNNQYKERYNVTSVMTVSTNKVDLVRRLMSQQADLLKQGVAITANDYNNTVIYVFTNLNSVKPKMIEQATKNARTAAEKFAKDSESDLGKIKSADQGQISIEDRDANTPFIKKVRVVTSIVYYLKD
ncbi:SIMPL domain-containing protein [Prevotella sp.]|uniref:SIMPL domain-containing protein n=1 Tax=Prevotella sp. TaxID=59823 RepID=UPI003DA63D64